MTIKEMVELTGCLPKEARLADGSRLKVFVVNKHGHYMASMWLMNGVIQDKELFHGLGITPDEATENLKQNILSL
jgi:hypothetical protein